MTLSIDILNRTDIQVAALGATVRRTARAAGRICRKTSTCYTGPCTRAATTSPEACTSYPPSWAVGARTCAPPPISCAAQSSAFARPTSNLGPTEKRAYVSIS